MRTFDRIAVLLLIVGALDWLTVGLFSFDFVAAIFGGVDACGAGLFIRWWALQEFTA